jgi:hypothetical protein
MIKRVLHHRFIQVIGAALGLQLAMGAVLAEEPERRRVT